MIGMPEFIAEMRLKELKKENRSKIHKKWRWDVTIYKMVDGPHSGVADRREHLGAGGFGYTHTKWGALRQIAKAYAKAQENYNMQ